MIRRAARAFVAATLAAGIVGALRHRAESRAVAEGELPAASAASDVAPNVRYTNFADGLSRWVPQPPRTPVSRGLARLWAAPATLVGLVLAATTGRRAVYDAERDCWVVTGARGLSRVALGWIGADANTMGQVIVCTGSQPSDALLAHEAVHVRQFERLGPLMIPVYLWLSARYGYRDHPLERAARVGARRELTDRPDRS